MIVLFRFGFDVLFSELYKIMVNKVTFLDFRVGDPPLNPLLFRGSIGYKKCAFLAAMLLCFFTHSINQGWANLFNTRVICRKPKTLESRKTTL